MKKQLSFVVYFEGEDDTEVYLERKLRETTKGILKECQINVFKKEHKINNIRG